MASSIYSMFENARNIYISGGIFHNGPTVVQPAEDAARNLLAAHIAPSALPNSDAMYDGPKCYPQTRKAIHRKLARWIRQQDDVATKFIWLQGGAGAGKSAIMRTVALGGPSQQDNHADAPHVLGSFFFSRQDPTRNTARTLIPTLAFQLCDAHPAAKDIILQTIADKRELIFTTSIQNQVRSLLIRPLNHLEREYGWLSRAEYIQDIGQPGRIFIIDGLDECESKRQVEIVEILATLVKELPIRVLLASRPDKPIPSAIHNCSSLHGIFSEISLSDDPNSDGDIRLFLEERLKQVRERWNCEPCGALPDSWPEEEDIEDIEWKSSKHFIYASTAEKYIASGHERPDVALRVILGLQVPRTGQPFEELDALYRCILGKARFCKEVLEIISFRLLLMSYAPTDKICYLLGHHPVDMSLFLSDMRALVTIDTYDCLHFHHQSFKDFLQDKARAQEFYIGTKQQFHRDHLQHYFALLDEYLATSNDKLHSYALVAFIAAGVAASPLSDTTTALIKQHPPQTIYSLLALVNPRLGITSRQPKVYASYIRAIGQYDFQNTCVYKDSLKNFLCHLQKRVASLSITEGNQADIIIPLFLAGYDISTLHHLAHQVARYDSLTDLEIHAFQGAPDYYGFPRPSPCDHRFPGHLLRQIRAEMVDSESDLEDVSLRLLRIITSEYPQRLEDPEGDPYEARDYSRRIQLLSDAVTFVLPKVVYRDDIASHAMCTILAPAHRLVDKDNRFYFREMKLAVKGAQSAMSDYLRRGGHLIECPDILDSEPGDVTEEEDGSVSDEGGDYSSIEEVVPRRYSSEDEAECRFCK